MPVNFCPYLRQILTDFKNSFTGKLCGTYNLGKNNSYFCTYLPSTAFTVVANIPSSCKLSSIFSRRSGRRSKFIMYTWNKSEMIKKIRIALGCRRNSSILFARWQQQLACFARGFDPKSPLPLGVKDRISQCVLRPPSVPAKWHANPSNGLSRVHKMWETTDRQTTLWRNG